MDMVVQSSKRRDTHRLNFEVVIVSTRWLLKNSLLTNPLSRLSSLTLCFRKLCQVILFFILTVKTTDKLSEEVNIFPPSMSVSLKFISQILTQ